MAEVTEANLVKLFKSNDELTQGEAAQRLGVTVGQIPMLLFCQAKVAAGVEKKAPATQVSVKNLRNAGDRWELIAAKTGLSVAKVKDFAKAAGVLNTYTGRGRNFAGTGSSRKTSGSSKASGAGRKTGKTGAAAKSSGGRPSKTKSAGGRPSKSKTAGGRPSKSKTAGASRKAANARPSIQRNRAAGRRSTANPS